MGLYVAKSVGILRHRPVIKTVTLANGERAKVTIDDSGTVRHVEHGEVLDVLVRPKTLHLKLKGH